MWQTVEEICQLLDIPFSKPLRGSGIPLIFFSDIASKMGIPQRSSILSLAQSIIEHSNLPWSSEFICESRSFAGEKSLTNSGLIQLKNAILVWLDKDFRPKSTLVVGAEIKEWEPDAQWNALRELLPQDFALVTNRPGAEQFRKLVIEEYNGMCAISRFQSQTVLDVAHIVPYYGAQSDVIQNALLLRTDLHRLFDRGLLLVSFDKESKSFVTQIHKSVMNEYAQYNSVKLAVPNLQENHPSKTATEIKKALSLDLWST